MADITNLLIALTFVVIGIAFLIAFFVIRCKLNKNVNQILNNQSNTSGADSVKVIENNKKLIWYLGIAYVTISLALFFEGISGISDIKVVNALFIAFGVIFFLYGVVLTAYGVLALYNSNEKKYGKMQKAILTTICNLNDGKKLLVFVPKSSFGAEALTNVEVINEDAIQAFRKANGRIVDFCIVDDASNYRIGSEYIIYTNILRMKYMSVNITFLTTGAIDAVVTEVITPEKEIKEIKAEQNVELPQQDKVKQQLKKQKQPTKKVQVKKTEAKKVETKQVKAQPKKAEKSQQKATKSAQKTTTKPATKKAEKTAK